MSDKAIEFAQWCQINLQSERPPHEDYVEYGEIKPLKEKYHAIFGEEITAESIVRLISRGNFYEIEMKGTETKWAFHRANNPPPYLRRTIELCKVEFQETFLAENIKGGCNLPPKTELFVWKLC